MRKLLAALLVGLVSMLPLTAVAEEETKAIDFQFTDINGKSLRLSDFKGKWVLVNFWAPWCPLCWVEVPALNELNKRKDFVVIGIGLDYGPEESVVRESAQRHNLDFYAVVAGGARRNPDSPFRQVGPVDFYPTSYLYAPNGEIVMFVPGQVKMNKVMAFMEAWGPKKNSQIAKNKEEARAVQDVSYKKPAAPHSTPGSSFGGKGTVTY